MDAHDTAAVIGALAAPREGAAHLASRRAAANDPGSIFATVTIYPAHSTSYDTHARIRTLRALYIGELVASFMWDLAMAARRSYRRLRRYRRGAVGSEALHELDDRALRDIGLSRGDLPPDPNGVRDDWRLTA